MKWNCFRAQKKEQHFRIVSAWQQSEWTTDGKFSSANKSLVISFFKQQKFFLGWSPHCNETKESKMLMRVFHGIVARWFSFKWLLSWLKAIKQTFVPWKMKSKLIEIKSHCNIQISFFRLLTQRKIVFFVHFKNETNWILCHMQGWEQYKCFLW